MARFVFVLWTDKIRADVCDLINKLPKTTRVTIFPQRRTLPQNARMWAMLTDIATQLQWHGLWLSTDDWKLIFMASLNTESRLVPNLDGDGFVDLGRSTSELTIGEMGDLMALMDAFAANHGVKFSC